MLLRKKDSAQLAKLGINASDFDSVPAVVWQKLQADLRSWNTLHKKLAELTPDAKSIKVLQKYLYLEVAREGGPRLLMINRLYMRYSNLRRDMETTVLKDVTGLELGVAA